jgi:hypothetical protein
MHRVSMEKYERPAKQLRRPEAPLANVRLWHLADMDVGAEHVRSGKQSGRPASAI